jgi:hypothetical protein
VISRRHADNEGMKDARRDIKRGNKGNKFERKKINKSKAISVTGCGGL